MNINIPITTTREHFFNEYYLLMRPFYERYLSKKNDKKIVLYNNELKLLGWVMYYFHSFLDIEDIDQRWKMVFDIEIRARIRSRCNMSVSIFDNYIYKLKEKGVFEVWTDINSVRHKKLDAMFIIKDIENDMGVHFNFVLKN